MNTIRPQTELGEIAKRGNDIYDRVIGSRFEPTSGGKFVVIDVESGDFEVDENEVAATDRLLARHPKAELFLRRIGSPFARRFGYRGPERKPGLKDL